MTDDSATQPCHHCEHPLRHSARFCGRCGQPQPEPAGDDTASLDTAAPTPASGDMTVPAATADDTDTQTATAADSPTQDTGTNVATPETATADTTDSVANTHVASVAAPATAQRRPPRRWWMRPVVIGAACLVAASTGAGFLTAALLQPTPAPTSSPATSATSPTQWTTVPGWSTTPTWEHGSSVDGTAVAADGKQIITRSGDTIEVLSEQGTIIDTTTLPGTTTVVSGWVDAKPALVAVGDHELRAWVDGADTAQVFPVNEQSTVAVRGRGIVVTDSATNTMVLRTAGLTPYTTPRPGAVPLAVLDDGSLQWASARGEVLTASAAGTTINSTTLQPPVDGAKITRWLTGGTSIIVIWTSPDGNPLLGTHLLSGVSTAPEPLTPDVAATALVVNAARTKAMLGNNLIDLTSATPHTPDQEFTASLALGDSFYGATGTTTAVLTENTVTAATAPATVVPIGTTADGGLVATASGHVLLFPHASAHR